MKIAILGHKQIASRSGGIEVVVGQLVRRYIEHGHQVIVFDRSEKKKADATSETGGAPAHASRSYYGARVVSVPTIQYGGLSAMSASLSATILAITHKPDVIHFHAEGTCVPLVLAKLFGIRTVVTIHGLDWQRAKWGKFASWYIRLGERIAAKYADEIIVPSKNIQQYFIDQYGRNTHFIPNGIDQLAPVEAQDIVHKYGLHPRHYLLYVGRIVPEKGLQYLVHAYQRIQPDMPLVIVGNPDSQEYYQSLRELASRNGDIRFLGHVEGQLLAELYSHAYAFILPSDVEGMPMSLLEAMSYSNCCITSDIPECAQIVHNDVGLLFKHGDVESLAHQLQYVCAHSTVVSEYRRKAKERSLQYSWDTVVAQTLKLYQ